jgi:peptidoglycan/xylan/chitin deacetylase (PgdA/CDA1 family)
MSLLVLMYHRARAGPDGNSPEILDAHFGHIARHCHNVLPGDPLVGDRLNVCLSFDDGYFDFYAVAFPLLRKHGLKALLAIPPGFICEFVQANDMARREVSTRAAMLRPASGGFCTWPELEKIAGSGHVQIAAHGYTHQPLDDPDYQWPLEVEAPQTVLASRLGQTVDSFVFPYGRFTFKYLRRARRHYRHVFRIGGALNRNWSGHLLYRIPADNMAGPQALFSPGRLVQYRVRNLWNRFRLR